MGEFGRVWEIRKLSMNAGKSTVMRCSRNGNEGRMYVRINGEPFEEVDCFKYLGSQVAADGGCERDEVHRMDEAYRAWGATKSGEQLRIENKCEEVSIIIIITAALA